MTATKIMIIRHAEKPSDANSSQGIREDGQSDPESLTVRGWQRAGALVGLFAPAHGPLQSASLATPQTIFASEKESGGGSQRPLETITPLARRLKINPTTLHKNKLEKLAKEAMACTGTVLIAWQHEDIPPIAGFLPCDQTAIPQKWPGHRFDVVWVFDLDSHSTSYTFSQVPQELLDGDSPDVI